MVVAATVVCRRRLVCRVCRSRFVVVIRRLGLESLFFGGFQPCGSHQAVSPRWRGIAQRCGRNANGAHRNGRISNVPTLVHGLWE